jgi:hypothetical protein
MDQSVVQASSINENVFSQLACVLDRRSTSVIDRGVGTFNLAGGNGDVPAAGVLSRLLICSNCWLL